jgi:hypothetical protein
MSQSHQEVIEKFRKMGNLLFESEFTELLDCFIEGKLKFSPIFCILYHYPFDNSYVLNLYEDMEQKTLFKSIKLENTDLVYTGMTVESTEGQFEL